ncbi:cytochrome b [Sulfitobacter sp.]|uniref:cytochrome b n=1 Tax=Sulfitobacter sp. TaxID=1903071 RepID=UPI003296B849
MSHATTVTTGAASYGRVSRANHWITATLFLSTLGLGFLMAYGGLARSTIGAIMDWHKLLGLSVLLYGIWRVGWRMWHGFAAPAAPMPRWQKTASKLVHVGLLVAILAMPLSGVTMTLAGGHALDLWGVTLLSAGGEVGWLGALAGAIHAYAPWAILLLLAAHVGAALKHHVIDGDDTLRRMAAPAGSVVARTKPVT